MYKLVIVMAMLATGCGTKQNPRACCTDAADCMNVGLPVGTTCDEGLLCRGNRCVEQPCSRSGQCDVSAPYCVITDGGSCAEACTADSECPGFGQSSDATFCVDGDCAQCRAGMADCPADAPVCSSMGSCVTCELNGDCASGICASGRCVDEEQIAHVAVNGSTTSACTLAEPCSTVQRALTVAADKPYVLIGMGSYTSSTAIAPTGTRTLVGKGGRPVLTRNTPGPIIDVTGTVDIKLDSLEVVGATGTTNQDEGDGIRCASFAGAPKIEVVNVRSHSNSVDGFHGGGCDVTLRQSEFLRNGNDGVEAGEGTSKIDRVVASENGTPDLGGTGLFLDGGIHVVTNSFVTRNVARGIDIYSPSVGSRIEHNTIADNGIGFPAGCGVACGLPPGSHPNNLIIRNEEPQVFGCSFPNSIVDANAEPVKFRHAESAPYDYHIQSGSSAIDLGSASAVVTDFDGEMRPAGQGPDIGADELH